LDQRKPLLCVVKPYPAVLQAPDDTLVPSVPDTSTAILRATCQKVSIVPVVSENCNGALLEQVALVGAAQGRATDLCQWECP